MTKKTKMVLFMLAATVFNIVLMVMCFTILYLLYTALLVPRIPAQAALVGIPVLFIASFILSFLIYQRVLKLYLKKHPLNGQTLPDR